MSVYSSEDERRFQRHVIRHDDGCWEWDGSTNGLAGYGVIRVEVDGRRERHFAHRLSWMIHVGPIPDGMFVCHHCDNPPCARPDHLFISDHVGNMADMRRKGRGAEGDRSSFRLYPELYYGDRHWAHRRPELIRRGEDAGMAKLTQEQAQWVLNNVSEWGDVAQAARRFGVTEPTIHNILTGRTWAHLIGERHLTGPKPDTTEDRFWSKVDQSDADSCWRWIGAHNKQGQGVFHCRGKDTSARRVAYELTRGDIPRGHVVSSTCSTLDCCNPAHIYARTAPKPPNRWLNRSPNRESSS